MKNQYFGDLKDYQKYGVLRILANAGKNKIVVCWMLTDNDRTGYGNSVEYLHFPERALRDYDPTLFESLRRLLLLSEKERSVQMVEGLIPGASFYSKKLTCDIRDRKHYFEEFLQQTENTHLVFLDPDIGMEVASIPRTKKRSPQHLYWDELSNIYFKGLSIILYQHYRRVNHESFIKEMALEMINKLGAQQVISFQTPEVVFFLVPQDDHHERLLPLVEQINRIWHPQIKVRGWL
jgi:hypothetical protein